MKNEGEKRALEEKRLEGDLRRIAGLVAAIPDREPPSRLVDSVMIRIKPKRSSRLWVLWRRLTVPVPLSPLKVASVSGALIALAFVSVLHFVESPPEQSQVTPLQHELQVSARTVFFSLEVPGATKVELIGSFNQWRPGDLPMHWDESLKAWTLTLDLQKGRYEYAFLVDEQVVMPDPKALLHQEDGFGNRNSILIVERNNGHATGI